MATIKLLFRESSIVGGYGALYVRVIHKRVVRQIHTGCHILCDEWDENTNSVKYSEDISRIGHLDSVTNTINDITRRLNTIVAGLNRLKIEYTVDEIVESYLSSDTVVGLISFARKLIRDTERMGRAATAEHYSSALNSFIRYHGEREIPFEEIDCNLISEYERYLKKHNLCPNTTSYYMRSLRSIYNHAVEQALTDNRNPFRYVYTGVAKTLKRSVPIDTLRRLYHLDVSYNPLLELTRDVFIFSFCTRGMAFVDIAYLKKCNIKNGFLKYRRHKTARQLVVKWEKAMQNIADKYSTGGSEYVFPLITAGSEDVRKQYLNAYKSFSRRLRKLGQMVGLADALTFHRARHTWASVARRNRVPISVIKDGMGHDSERTTQIYLDSLDRDDIDKANCDIISLLYK